MASDSGPAISVSAWRSRLDSVCHNSRPNSPNQKHVAVTCNYDPKKEMKRLDLHREIQLCKRIFGTVLREFWFPAAIAGSFIYFGVSADRLRTIQGYFFGFLMLAWFTGQIVRIRREIERKDSTKATLENLSNVSKKLDSQLEMIIGHNTGGNSYAEIESTVNQTSGDVSFGTFVNGRFPIRDVSIISQDLAHPSKTPYETARHDYERIIYPGTLWEQMRWPADGREQYNYLMQISAFNHNSLCEVAVRRTRDGKFLAASRRRIDDQSWIYSVPNEFPGHELDKPERLFKFDELPDEYWAFAKRQYEASFPPIAHNKQIAQSAEK